jgi:hypothetical protein
MLSTVIQNSLIEKIEKKCFWWSIRKAKWWFVEATAVDQKMHLVVKVYYRGKPNLMSDIYKRSTNIVCPPPKDRTGRQYKPSYQTFAKFTCSPGHVTPRDHMTLLCTCKITQRTCKTICYMVLVVLYNVLITTWSEIMWPSFYNIST